MRDIKDLENKAIKFWPSEIAEKEKASSIIPKLIETQDKFISLLNISDANPFKWKETLSNSKSLPGNLFLKHLIVLSDVGGEKLMRFKKKLPSVFNDEMTFVWDGKYYTYKFQTLSNKATWNNKNLFVDGEGLIKVVELSPMMEDVCMILLFGGSAINDKILNEILEKCIIGTMIGKSDELDNFVRQRYIWVSRITGGAEANTLGQLTQNYVKDYLKIKLPDWRINKDQLPNVSQNERTSLSVDIIAKSPIGKFCAVEVSFQVTTNSTIERKAGQAQARQELLHSKGHKIAYVIDGAGNFARQSALRTICQYSDCTVTFKDSELDELVKFLKTIK
ncbi:MAG: hypothetical protein JW702_09285 [Clostridiales bacterium]|nr:hypothetical protein [Clostridiales bacterium]